MPRGCLKISMAWMIAVIVSVGVLRAQEDASKAPADPAAADSKKADAPPTDATPEKGAAAAGGNATARFNDKLNEWKGILKEMRTIREKHLTANPAEAAALEKEWADWIAKGESLLPELRATGIAAYAESKDDRNIERFLVQVLSDDVAHDRFETASELGKAMLAAGTEVKQVFDLTGVAAFATNDYDAAGQYLTDAKNAGVLSENGEKFLELVPEYKEYWATEQKIREKEGSAEEGNQLPLVKITTTEGEILVELFENQAPGAVGNFVSLVEKKFYDGLAFHRVLPGFMAQGGCPKGDGTGGPGYNIYCEWDQPDARKHFRGTLSMAHAGKDTGGSQFFLTFVPTAHLNGRHTAFGRVVEGMDVLGRLQRVDPSQKSAQPSPDKILKMEVLRKRDHEYKPNKVQ